MDNPETQATLGTRHRRGNQEWTIQRHRQHWALDTEEAIRNGQSRDIGNIGHYTQKGQSRMDNPQTQTTLGTRHRRAIKNGQSGDTGNIGL